MAFCLHKCFFLVMNIIKLEIDLLGLNESGLFDLFIMP